MSEMELVECQHCNWAGRGYEAFGAHLREKHPEVYVVKPICPSCIEVATYQTPDGTFWCRNAHHWRSKYQESKRAGQAERGQ